MSRPGTVQRIVADLAAEARFLVAGGAAQGRLALCVALGATGAVLLALALGLDDPWWAGITAVAVLQSEARATLVRSVERMLGTIAGAVIGFLLVPTLDSHLLFFLACAGVVGFTIYAQERTSRSYTVMLGGVTSLLILFGSLTEPDKSLNLAVYRCLEVLTGVVSGSLAAYLLHPRRGLPPAFGAARPGIFARPVDADLLGLALIGGVSVAAIPGIWEVLQLPGLGQTPVTAFVMVTALRGDVLLRGLTRCLGCVLGGLYGIAVLGLVGDAFLPWLVCLAFGLYVAGFLQHGGGDASYSGQQASIALLVALVQGSGPTPDILPAVNRLTGIIGGIVLVWLFVFLLDPLRVILVRRFKE